jgi:uncharacterized protein YprB with RNaseH-like and TPR domain
VSDLRARLGALRQESGLTSASDDAGPMPGSIDALRRRLQRMGAGQRRRSPVRKSISDQTLAAGLGGHLVCDGVIRIRERLDADAVHGDFPLFDPALYQALSLCSSGEDGIPRACVFMDTETTGLAGGTGTLVFLLGLARFSGAALEICQLLLTGFRGESAMLGEARDFLRDTDTLVTFNGRSFDSPLLAARYRLSGMDDPFAALRHVDLLHPTRRTFKNCWPDCRLQTAERRLLGVERIGDLPGCEAPRAWFEWLRHGRDDALPGVCSHNRLDLLSLAVLPVALQRSYADPVAAGANVLACARHYCQRRDPRIGPDPGPSFGPSVGPSVDHEGGNRREDQAIFEYLRRYRARLDTEGLLELARLARRRGEWVLAVDLWERLAADGLLVALEHLAKYYEHQQRDYARALQITSRLLACAPHDRQHRRRDTRLRGRLASRRY